MYKKCIKNDMLDYDTINRKYLNEHLTDISIDFKKKLLNYESKNIIKFSNELKNEVFSSSCVYTGSGGVAYLYYLQSKSIEDTKQKDDVLMKALEIIKLKSNVGERITFLCGGAGPLALTAVIAHHLGPKRPAHIPSVSHLIQRLEQLLPNANSCASDEILYGRAGYLYALLFVNKETGENLIQPSIITKVITKMLESGEQLAQEMKMERAVPLLYKWHDSYYLGAAHGTAGILYMFLQSVEYMSVEQLQGLVKPTLDWLLRQRYPSGNLPSSLGSDSDRLVQWCHGAPGLIQLCCLAYKVFGHEEYLKAAELCGEVVWQRGLCSKGYSICHGVSGNAYTFLQLYQTTKDPKHLHRACSFMDWCIDEPEGSECHFPDAPASLYEGLAGRIYLARDMLLPMNAKFPVYSL